MPLSSWFSPVLVAFCVLLSSVSFALSQVQKEVQKAHIVPPASWCPHGLNRPTPCSLTQITMMRPLALEMLPVVAFLLCLVATSSPSEPCVTQVSVDAFNVTTPFMMFECSRGYCGIDLPCGESSIGSPTPDNISSTSVAMPEVQKILSAMWTWSSKVLAEIDRVVWQVVRETDPTIVTKCRLCLLAMGMYDWEPRWRWPLHTHRSKNHPTVTDVVSLVCKGLGLVVVVRFLEVLARVRQNAAARRRRGYG